MSGGSEAAPRAQRRGAWSRPGMVAAACVLALVGALSLALWKVVDLRGELARRAPGIGYGAVHAVLEAEIDDSEGRRMRMADGDWEHLVLFVFTPYDCPGCLDELADLEALRTSVPSLGVYAILAHGSPDEARQTRDNFGLEFPVIPDPEGSWLGRLAPPETPWKVVVRRDEGIVFEDPKSTTPSERRAFSERVHFIVGR